MTERTPYREMAAIQAGDQKEMNRYTAESRKAAMIRQAATGESALERLRQNGSLEDGRKPAPPDDRQPPRPSSPA